MELIQSLLRQQEAITIVEIGSLRILRIFSVDMGIINILSSTILRMVLQSIPTEELSHVTTFGIWNSYTPREHSTNIDLDVISWNRS